MSFGLGLTALALFKANLIVLDSQVAAQIVWFNPAFGIRAHPTHFASDLQPIRFSGGGGGQKGMGMIWEGWRKKRVNYTTGASQKCCS